MKFLLDSERKLFILLAKNFQQGCQNSILRVHMTISGFAENFRYLEQKPSEKG